MRGALIGLGNVALHGHLPGWRRRRDVEIVGGTDARPEQRAVLVAHALGTRWYSTVVELLSEAPPRIAGRERVFARHRHQRTEPLNDFRNRQQPLHAGEVDAAVVDQPLDRFEALQLAARVEPHAADGAGRLDQAEPLVLSERLRMHAKHPGSRGDEDELLDHTVDTHQA